MSDLLTVGEAATRLKVNSQTVRRWIRQGILPAAKIGRKEWRIRAEDLPTAGGATASVESSPRPAMVVDQILALRRSLEGRGISVVELVAEGRAELERPGAAGSR